jgi:hypothetical protein
VAANRSGAGRTDGRTAGWSREREWEGERPRSRKIAGVGAKPRPALDLQEVTLVDVGAVRFLSACEQNGVERLHCAQYIRLWMASDRPGQGDSGDGGDKAERKG